MYQDVISKEPVPPRSTGKTNWHYYYLRLKQVALRERIESQARRRSLFAGLLKKIRLYFVTKTKHANVKNIRRKAPVVLGLLWVLVLVKAVLLTTQLIHAAPVN